MKAEQVTGDVAFHGEGPVWSPAWGGLRWLDMLRGDYLALSADGLVERHHVGRVAAAVRPRAGGGAVWGVERGFLLESPDGMLTRLPELWHDDDARMNEGGCDPDGRFYCGSMANDKRSPAGALFRLDPDGTTCEVFGDVVISNGLEWSPDGTLAYYIDTPTQTIAMFDYDRIHGLANRRTFVDIDPGIGRPDGLTVDAEGGVWVALSTGQVVRRYAPDGSLSEVVEVPAQKVTACTFGGENLDELFITTSKEGVEDDSSAGALYRAEVGVRGLAARTFAG